MESNNKKFRLLLKFIELTLEKSEWEISNICEVLNINQDEFDYIVNTLSDLYISNDFDLFLDIEIDNEKIHVVINDIVADTHFITDYDILSIYKILLDSNIDYLESYIQSDQLEAFKYTLEKYIPIKVDKIDSIELGDINIFEEEAVAIDYSPLGTVSSSRYHIEPISIVKNKEGVALHAFDIQAKRAKTFLLNRIFDISNELHGLPSEKSSSLNKEYELTFSFRYNHQYLTGIDSKEIINKRKNVHSLKFRNKLIALEFYKKNIYKIKAIDNKEFDKEIKSSLNNVIKLINK